MSKDKPEVGDVWGINNSTVKLYTEIVEEDIIIALQTDDTFHILNEIMVDKEVLNKHCQYLGKSKANIEQLFEVAQNYKAELAKVKQQLAIAVEALKNIRAGNKMVFDKETGTPYFTEELALQQIKELEK